MFVVNVFLLSFVDVRKTYINTKKKSYNYILYIIYCYCNDQINVLYARLLTYIIIYTHG